MYLATCYHCNRDVLIVGYTSDRTKCPHCGRFVNLEKCEKVY
jgi:hypothetical protein